MVDEILGKVRTLFEKELKIPLEKNLNDYRYCTVLEFHKETKVYILADFIAAYVYFNNTNWILINPSSFNYLNENRKTCAILHECMHLVSTKVSKDSYEIGFTIKNSHLVALNEGVNEIAADYVYNRICIGQYAYSKGYYINRKIAEYIVNEIYPNKEDFVKEYVTENSYEFYKKVYYHFKANNLLELHSIILKIKDKYNMSKQKDKCEDIIKLYLQKR